MTCSSCVSKIERNISKVNGIHGILVALLSQKAEVLYDDDLISTVQIVKLIQDMGYQAAFLNDSLDTQYSELSLRILGMSCSSCVHKIETTVNKLEGLTLVSKKKYF